MHVQVNWRALGFWGALIVSFTLWTLVFWLLGLLSEAAG
jgi:hypothetical protein